MATVVTVAREAAMDDKLATEVAMVAKPAMAVAMVGATAAEATAAAMVRAVVFKTLATSREEEATEDLSRVMATAKHKTLLVFKASDLVVKDLVDLAAVVAMESVVAMVAMAAMVVPEASATLTI